MDQPEPEPASSNSVRTSFRMAWLARMRCCEGSPFGRMIKVGTATKVMSLSPMAAPSTGPGFVRGHIRNTSAEAGQSSLVGDR